MLRSVERALAGVGLHPNNEVLQLAVDLIPGCHELAEVTPVDADKMDGSIGRPSSGKSERL